MGQGRAGARVTIPGVMTNEMMAAIVGVGLTGLGVLVMVLARAVSGNKLLLTEMKREMASLPRSDDVAALRVQVTALAGEMASLPRSDDVAALRVQVAALAGKLDVIEERTAWISRSVDRHERLLDGTGKGGAA